jgi:hypothetical protein
VDTRGELSCTVGWSKVVSENVIRKNMMIQALFHAILWFKREQEHRPGALFPKFKPVLFMNLI